MVKKTPSFLESASLLAAREPLDSLDKIYCMGLSVTDVVEQFGFLECV